jgi:hypothetical protein
MIKNLAQPPHVTSGWNNAVIAGLKHVGEISTRVVTAQRGDMTTNFQD